MKKDLKDPLGEPPLMQGNLSNWQRSSVSSSTGFNVHTLVTASVFDAPPGSRML